MKGQMVVRDGGRLVPGMPPALGIMGNFPLMPPSLPSVKLSLTLVPFSAPQKIVHGNQDSIFKSRAKGYSEQVPSTVI